MKIILTLILMMIITGFTNSQTVMSNDLTGDIVEDIKLLLPIGKIEVDIIDSVIMPSRWQELNLKLLTAVRQHKEWFNEQIKIVEQTGEPLKYHSNLGMTEEEFNEWIVQRKNGTDIEMVKSGSETVFIKSEDNVISFSSTGKLEILDSIKIDLKEKIVRFGYYKLEQIDTINVDSDKNGLKSKWKGYSWRYDFSNKPDGFNALLEDMEEVKTLKMKILKLTIGKLETDGKTYIEITHKELENGIRIKNIQIPFKF
ncbi:hypothetical protein ACFLSQ_03485 [Bacteroidota bacterium]